MAYDPDHHDVIIEREGTGAGTILGILLAVRVMLAIIWFFFLGGYNPAPGNNNTAPQQNQQQQQGQPYVP